MTSLVGPTWMGGLVLASLAGPGLTVTLDRRSGVAGVPLTRGRAVAGPELSRRACEEHPLRRYARASEASERETPQRGV